MKALTLLLLSVSLGAAAQGQQQPPPPSSPTQANAATNVNTPEATPSGVVVLKHSWSKERINWERDPFGGTVENFDEMRVRARNERRIEDAKRGGNSIEENRIRREARADAANMDARRKQEQRPARYVFAYKVSLRNDSAKTIKAIDWDYLFFDAATGDATGIHQFTSEEKIGAGKTKQLVFTIPTPPTRTVSAHALNDNERDNLTERVRIVRIIYTDGSVWQQPSAP
ncbi:MAG TPA: hypothetical protein VGV59_08470 [Pyrinomonadaceae bacterium]|nr:hypothetical protein [Pyrinomonadaceae bacterium]